jgi:hypothetical protein
MAVKDRVRVSALGAATIELHLAVILAGQSLSTPDLAFAAIAVSGQCKRI